MRTRVLKYVLAGALPGNKEMDGMKDPNTGMNAVTISTGTKEKDGLRGSPQGGGEVDISRQDGASHVQTMHVSILRSLDALFDAWHVLNRCALHEEEDPILATRSSIDSVLVPYWNHSEHGHLLSRMSLFETEFI